MGAFVAIVMRDLRLAGRGAGNATTPVAFFVLATALFAIAVGPAAQALRAAAPGLLWVAVLLAALLSLDRLFQSDFEDGALDRLAMAPLPMEVVVLAKILAHWLTTALPLVVLTPIIGILLALPEAAFGWTMAALVIGTPALSLIGAIGAALAVLVRRGTALLPVLVLPLMVPTLIFGLSAVEAALFGLPVANHLILLGAVSLFACVLGPVAASAALRLALR